MNKPPNELELLEQQFKAMREAVLKIVRKPGLSREDFTTRNTAMDRFNVMQVELERAREAARAETERAVRARETARVAAEEIAARQKNRRRIVFDDDK